MNLTRKEAELIRAHVYYYHPFTTTFLDIFLTNVEKPFLYEFNHEALSFLDFFFDYKLTYKFLNKIFQQNPDLYQKLKSSNLGKLALIKIIESDEFKQECQNIQIVNHYVLDKSTKREYPALMNQEEKVIPLILKTHPELTTKEAKDEFIENNIEIIRKTHWAEKIAQRDRYHLPKDVLKFEEPLYIDKHQTMVQYIKKALKQCDAIKSLKQDQCVSISYKDENEKPIYNVHHNLKDAMLELSKLGQNVINEYIKTNLYRTELKLKKPLLKYYNPNYQTNEITNAKILHINLTDDLIRERTLFLVLKNPLKQDS